VVQAVRGSVPRINIAATMIRIRQMEQRDLALGMRLKEQAGWNQTLSDWQRILELEPDGCFVAEYDGVAVGTATTCVFDSVAWVAMVLVDEPFRRRGIGSRLMEHTLQFLDARQVATVRLDATPLGRRLYEKLRFLVEYDLTRWEGVPQANAATAADGLRVEQLPPERLEDFCAADRQVTGTDRRRLLERLFAEDPRRFCQLCRGDTVLGYWASRPGSKAVQLGPVLAQTAESVGPVVHAALCAFAGQNVFIDVPVLNCPAAEEVAKLLKPQRTLTRMCRGQRVAERSQLLCASFGPEKG